ncbi:uncharacterized protein [Chelonus insularis]|uniref:uncharacterized protein isoform X2 n=1 Tax=Chelonus insularis TaxID=460826 RepID=UPI00158D0983|nr:uncharacterized protein LOC118074336 isoform X2 [Chelonus insularis]
MNNYSKMEKDDFGFTQRDPWILQRVTTAGEKTMDYERGLRQATFSPKLNYPKGEVCRSGITTEGVAKEGSTSQETGSSQVNTHQRPETSVIRDPPNIPNVVEYHLKYPSLQQQKSLVTNRLNENTREMRTEESTPLSSRDDKKSLISRLSNLSIDNNVFEGSDELPQVFQVKYLGSHDARGLWGIKHTRKPVDSMVATAKSLPTDTMLPLMKLVVSCEGVTLLPFTKRKLELSTGKNYPIEIISYGVQDLVYTRVFSMIAVRDTSNFRKVSPFECHAFVCESKHHARQLTYALATAFQIYSQTVKGLEKIQKNTSDVKKKFAIDLRTPEEIESDLTRDSEA